MLATYNNNRSRVLDNDALHAIAPSIFAEHASSDRSARYRFLPTIDVIEGLRNEGFQVVAAGESRTRKEEHEGFARHQIRLRAHDGFQALNQVLPEIVVTNSHNGASAYNINAGLYRLVCNNGLIVADSTLETVKVRHSGRAVLDDVIEGVYRVVAATNLVESRVEEFGGIQLPAPVQQAFATAALDLRWERDANGNSTAPIQAAQLLRPRRFADSKDDLFTVFNRVQESLIRGGISGRNSTGGRYTTRAVNSVSEDSRLNKALWTLADELAAIVG